MKKRFIFIFLIYSKEVLEFLKTFLIRSNHLDRRASYQPYHNKDEELDIYLIFCYILCEIRSTYSFA
jgi:hypothetical protein